jgi:hypothetical protein
MHCRSILVTSLAGLLLASGQFGCSMFKFQSKPTDPTVVRPSKLDDLLEEDRERLAGPDSPHHLRHTYFGVDVTDDSFLMATWHLISAIPYKIYYFATGDTPIKYAGMMEDSHSPDRRRTGMLTLASRYRFARAEPYTRRYSQIGTGDSEALVRAAAIRALNRSRSRLNENLFVTGIDDADVTVRLEAAKALANVPVEKAVPRLIEHLQRDENRDVRIACADALCHFKTLDVARALIGVLNDRDFGTSWQARRSLMIMTGRDFRYDEAAWLGYFSQAKKAFI